MEDTKPHRLSFRGYNVMGYLIEAEENKKTPCLSDVKKVTRYLNASQTLTSLEDSKFVASVNGYYFATAVGKEAYRKVKESGGVKMRKNEKTIERRIRLREEMTDLITLDPSSVFDLLRDAITREIALKHGFSHALTSASELEVEEIRIEADKQMLTIAQNLRHNTRSKREYLSEPEPLEITSQRT